MVSVNDLEQFPIFSGMDRDFLAEVAKLCSRRHFRAGEACVVEGEPARYLHLLVSGEITLERKLPEKWLFHSVGTVHTVDAGQLFGWSSLIGPRMHTATGRCEKDCDVVLIKGKELEAILDRGEKAGYQFMKRLATVIAMRLIDTSDCMMREMADFAAYRSM